MGAAERRLYYGIDVARVEAVAGRLCAIHFDIQVRLSLDVENTEIGDAPDLRHLVLNLKGQVFQNVLVVADDLDRVGAFDAGKCLLDIVLDVLGKVEAHPRQFIGKFVLDLSNQLVFGEASRPFVIRLERHEQFDIGERRSIAAVVGPAVLGNDVEHFGMTKQDLAHLRRRRLARLQSHRRRHRCPDPQIAFFQCRQELAAKPRRQEADPNEKQNADRQHGFPVIE